MSFPQFTPAELIRRTESFDSDDYIFELKMDRALAYVGQDETELVSWGRNVYKSFTDLCAAIHINLECEAEIDGEIVLDVEGRSQFYRLLPRAWDACVLCVRSAVAGWRGH